MTIEAYSALFRLCLLVLAHIVVWTLYISYN